MTPALHARAETSLAEADRFLAEAEAKRSALALATDHRREGHELAIVGHARIFADAMGCMWTATLLEDMAEDLREEHERRMWEALPRATKRGPMHRGQRVANMRERVEEAIAE